MSPVTPPPAGPAPMHYPATTGGIGHRIKAGPGRGWRLSKQSRKRVDARRSRSPT
jgi:hypothetical protein